MRYLNQLFDIRTGEWKRLLLLYGLAFLLNMSVVWGQAASEALFLKRIGVKYLPLMFIADALLNMIAIIVYGAFVDRISNTRLMIAISGFGSLLLVVARLGLLLDLTLVYALLYLLERVLRALISIHAWTYIADFYDTRTAKRHYSFIASASRPSGILAGLLVVPFVQLGGTENLLLAWIVVLLLSGGLAWIAPQQVDLVVELEKNKESSRASTYREGFQYVVSSTFLRYLAVAAVVGTIILYLLDYQSQLIFVNSFDSTEQLASFYGLLGAFSDLLILPIQLVILSRLVRRFGVGKANLIFPTLTSLSYILVSLLPSLPFAAFARMDRTALRSAFRTPIDGLLYNALPIALKGRARAFINGLLVPVGTLLAGFILLAVGVKSMSFSLLITFGLMMALIYMMVSFKIRDEYSNSLATLLMQDDIISLFRLSNKGFEGLDQTDPATVTRIQKRIETSTDDDLTIFLAELLCEIQGGEALEYLQNLARQNNPRVQAALIQMMGTLEGPSACDFCLTALNSPHANVRHAAVTVLAQNPEVSREKGLLDAFRSLLNDPDDAVQAAVIAPLMASGDFYYVSPAVELLTKWLDASSSIHYRTLGLGVLAEGSNEHLLPTLVSYLEDSDPLIRRQVVELIDHMVMQAPIESIDPSALKTLCRGLTDEDESVRLASVKALGHIKSKEAYQALFMALEDPSFMVRSQTCSLIMPGPELEEALEAENRYLAESAAYILASRPRVKRRLLQLIEELVVDVYTLHGQRLALDAFSTSGAELLKSMLQEEADQLLQRVFWLLAGLSDEQKAQAIQIALRRENSLTHANAVETLESIASPRLSHLIAPLFDETPLKALIQIGEEILELPPQNAWLFFCQAWPEWGGDNFIPTSFNLRSFYEQGWLTAIVIYTLSEMVGMELNDLEGNSFILSNNALLSALKTTLNNTSSEAVHETASLILSQMDYKRGLENCEMIC